MEVVTAAQAFAAMGSESRLDVLRVLVKAGESGLPVGDIQQRTGIPASTLSHHLKFLASADLIKQDKQGRAILNMANYDHLQQLASFILEECCTDIINTKDLSNG